MSMSTLCFSVAGKDEGGAGGAKEAREKADMPTCFSKAEMTNAYSTSKLLTRRARESTRYHQAMPFEGN